MWNSLSIRTQLSVLISSMLLIITLATLFQAYWLDTKERQVLAIELSHSLNKSMSQDMLKALLDNQSDTLSDLSYRLSQFESLDEVLLTDLTGKAVFEFNRKHNKYEHLVRQATHEPQFEGEDLFVKLPLQADGHTFGNVTYVIDMKSLTTQLNDHIMTLVIALPLELVIGLLLATWISHHQTQPFQKLALAMRQTDPTLQPAAPLVTPAKNEIKALFDGFNQMMAQIYRTTQAMRYQAEHDLLTGLYNRYFMEAEIRRALKDEQDNDYVLMGIDLDQFKLINDSAGHAAGDELLKMIALQTQKNLPNNAVMARLGGDDFFILMKNTSLSEGIAYAKERQENLKDFRFSWEEKTYSISASIGLVAFKPNQYSPEELTKALDNAFYAAKSQGRNKLHIYQPEDNQSQRFNQELIIAGFIKEALSEGPAHFELFAQAIVHLQKQTNLVSYEILLRLWDSNDQLISPDYFLPTAERYQMMAEIDMFVLWQYLIQATQTPKHIQQLEKVHINLAGSSLNNADFQAKVKQAVIHFNFPWHKLELEVTETSAIGNFSQAQNFINWLKNVGIGLALDDFGTGMSSFEYLKSLPFDVVKIDGSFVKDMHTDPSDKAVIRYIHEISELRNQKTVAEYVETQQDVDVLTEIGVTYGQGYFLGKPKPLTDWLNA
ncbi:MAG: EAL domain-containing protein [Thiotrichales bacterium]|nr:EAL domain-containing protein [Thiotrichales bacterium]